MPLRVITPELRQITPELRQITPALFSMILCNFVIFCTKLSSECIRKASWTPNELFATAGRRWISKLPEFN
jgi:hypothetical protein